MGFNSDDMLGKIGDLHHRMQYIFGGFPEDFGCVFGVMFDGIWSRLPACGSFCFG